MKKIEYMKPAMRVRFVMFDTPLCGDSIDATTDDEVNDSGEGGGAWAKDFDDEVEYPTGGNVWED